MGFRPWMNRLAFRDLLSEEWFHPDGACDRRSDREFLRGAQCL